MSCFFRLLFLFLVGAFLIVGCKTTEIKDDGSLLAKIQILEQRHNEDNAKLEAMISRMSAGSGSSSTGFSCGSNGGLRLTHSGPQNALRGASTGYQIKVTNVTNCPARDIEVYAYLPEGSQFSSASDGGNASGDTVMWRFEKMNVGEEFVISYEVMLGDSGIYRLCAFAMAKFPDCIETRVAEPVLTCNWTGPNRVRKGEEFEICIEIANSGDGDATGVEVDINLSGLSFPDGSSSRTLSNVSVRAGSSARECFRVVGTNDGMGEVQAVVRLGGGAQATSCGKTIEIATPDLTIEKTGPRRVNINSRFRYKIDVTNPSEAVNTNVVLTDRLPEGLEFAEASDGGSYNASNRSVTWNLGDIAPGETRSVNIFVKAILERDEPGWCNVASVRSNEVPPRDSEACTVVEAVPAMHIDGYDTEDPVQLGDTTIYVIEVRNEGKKAATQVQLSFDIDVEGEYVAHEGSALGRAIGGSYNGSGQIVFDAIPVMNPGDEAVFKITVKAIQEGSSVGTATVNYAEFTKPFQKQEPTTFYK